MTFRTGILIQARMSSSRVPGKMLLKVGDIPLIEFVYKRCLSATQANTVAVLTSELPSDDILNDYCFNHNIPVYRGPLENVLDRYIAAAEFYNLQSICRVCGDSPFVDSAMIDSMIAEIHSQHYDYVSLKNSIDGFLAEVVPLTTLQKVAENNPTPEYQEHVTYAIRQNPAHYKTCWIDMDQEALAKEISLTVDTAVDLQFCDRIAKDLFKKYNCKKFDFSSREIISIIKQIEPEAH